jgi:glucose/arabinose dehydrogenase
MRRIFIVFSAIVALAALPVTAQDVRYEAALEPVADGLTHPLMLVEAPDDTGRLFIVDQTGQIWIVTEDGQRLGEPFLNIEDRLVELNDGYDERGLLGLAFHPEYAENGKFYVFYSAPLRGNAPQNFDHTNRLSEFKVNTEDPNVADPDSERVVMAIDHPYANHNAGTVAFGQDGYLYVALGDGGNRDDEDTGNVEGHASDWYEDNAGGNGQDITQNQMGSILRIDVNRGEGRRAYAIPEDNPFVNTQGALPETWAYGFRNPYRFSFDREGDNALIVGDAGQELYEEISLVEKGGNYGWNVYEGRHCFDAASPTNPPQECPDTVGAGHPDEGAPLLMPVIEFKNSKQFPEEGLGLVVVGGNVYRGQALGERFDGKYLFGVWSRGHEHTEQGERHLRGALYVADPEGGEDWPFEELQITNRSDGRLDMFLLGFGQDNDGEVYVLGAGEPGPSGETGKVYRLQEAEATGQ